MEREPVMTTTITIAFDGGRKLEAEGTQWKEASEVFADALKRFLPSYLTGRERSDKNLEDKFEIQRSLGWMEAGDDKVRFKLHASRRMDITFNDNPQSIASLVDSTKRKLSPILVAGGIIFHATKLTESICHAGQAPVSKTIDLLSFSAKEE